MGREGRGERGSAADRAAAGNSLAVPRLSVCADVQKVDRSKLAQTEFAVIEFDAETFRLLLDYLHTGSCPLTCNNIPGLICAAEHYDLPELLQACFHHAKQFLRIEVVNFLKIIKFSINFNFSHFLFFLGLQYVVLVGELLLALYERFGTSQHDFTVCRDEGVPSVSMPRFPFALRIDRSDDNGTQSRSARSAQI